MLKTLRKYCVLSLFSVIIGVSLVAGALQFQPVRSYIQHRMYDRFIDQSFDQLDTMFERYKTQEKVTVGAIKEMSRAEIIIAVNNYVNQIPYAHDDVTYGPIEYFATPREMIEKGQGDCEDYAIMKYHFLKQLGVPVEDMMVMIGIHTSSWTGERGGHAILVVKHDGVWWVLNNGINRIIELKDYTQFHPLAAANEKSKWTSLFE